MEATAKQRNIIMSPRKIRRVINEIRGKSVADAHRILSLMPYRAAEIVLKNLLVAVSNAEVQKGMDPDQLFVSNVQADGGAVFVRFKPRAQGRMFRRRKPTSHLTISVSDKQNQE